MKTLKLRVKDKHVKHLKKMSYDVNFVWNYVNNLCYEHLKRTGKFFGAYEISNYTKGATKTGLFISSTTIQCINAEYATRRLQFKKAKLAWRKSFGSRKSLGWIPFRNKDIRNENDQIRFFGNLYSVFENCDLSQYELRGGSFNEDSRGRWYINICVEEKVKTKPTYTGFNSVGIDLGLKDLMTLSNGNKVEIQQTYRKHESKLATAQRAGKKYEVKNIHAKIKNIRKDFNHKLTNELVKDYSAIFIGNVSSSKLAKTKISKSVLDASWFQLKTMLRYKCDYAGVWFEEVNESYSTQVCSNCYTMCSNSPKGMDGLGIREWSCMECGVTHDRDVNAAKNILALGHGRLAGGSDFKSIKALYALKLIKGSR